MLLGLFKKEISSDDYAKFLNRFGFELMEKVTDQFHYLQPNYEKLSESTKSMYDWELYYFITANIYLFAHTGLKSDNTNEILSKYINECHNFLCSDRPKEHGNHSCWQLALRIKAYRLAWMDKRAETLIGVRSILQVVANEIGRTGDFLTADSILEQYIEDQDIIDAWKDSAKLMLLISMPLCTQVVSSIDAFIDYSNKNFKII